MKRIPVDFGAIRPVDRTLVFLNEAVHPELGSEIREGMRAIFFDEKIEVEGVVAYDSHLEIWAGRLDWSTKRDL
jgi:hypothetical protein